jgi:hypothetical protein
MRFRSKILTPLYNDLLNFRDELKTDVLKIGDSRCYWWEEGLHFKRDTWGRRRSPAFVVWTDMQEDFRALYARRIRGQVSRRLDDLLVIGREYNHKRTDFESKNISEIDFYIKSKTGKNFTTAIHSWILKPLILRETAEVVKAFKANELDKLGVSDEEMKEKADEFIKGVSEDSDLSSLCSLAARIVKEVDSLIASIGYEIINIIEVYELDQQKEKDAYPKEKAAK